MLNYTSLSSTAVVALIGLLVWWANPARRVNLGVFTCSLHSATWLLLLHVATAAPGRLLCLRWLCAVGAFIPLHFAALGETIACGTVGRRFWKRNGTLLVLAVLLAVDCFSNFFIPSTSSPTQRARGIGYYGYIVVLFVSFVWVCWNSYRDARDEAAERRLELEIWFIGLCASAAVMLAAMVLETLTHQRAFIGFQPVLVLIFYGGSVYAITTHQIFDASQILRLVLSRVILVAGAFGLVILLTLKLRDLVPWSVLMISVVVVVLVYEDLFGRWLDRRLQLFPQSTAARRAALEAASQEGRLERLEPRLREVLRGWGQSEQAVIAVEVGDNYQGSGLEIPIESGAMRELRRLKWASPERLAREKPSEARRELAAWLDRNGLKVATTARGSVSGIVVAVGPAASRRPFSVPQVAQLQELAAIFIGPLERAQLAVKMQHTEQLATVGMLGASLAHEIRNPLVSLKAFVQLLPTRHHEPAFRERFFHLMSEEVKRIDRLTEQLLDLASPRAYSPQAIELHPVIQAGLDLVRPRAMDAEVAIVSELKASPDQVLSDPAAVKQVLLNLCLNAIQVMEDRPGERVIMIGTASVRGGVELTVADTGPGIAREIQQKLFQPFQTTKSSGFGLGLAICRDILTSLGATIAAVPPEVGKGAVFRIVLPCPR